jgi:hypothetical protein
VGLAEAAAGNLINDKLPTIETGKSFCLVNPLPNDFKIRLGIKINAVRNGLKKFDNYLAVS